MASISVLGIPHQYESTDPLNTTQKPVLVFVHGWLLSHHYWQPLIEQLATDYVCLAYDLRGFGDSGWQDSRDRQRPYDLAAYAEDLIGLLQQLNITQAWLVGHSLGGSIALWAAYQAPEQVKGVIGLNSGGGIYLKEEFERFRNAGQQLVKYRPQWLKYCPGLDLIFARTMVAKPLRRLWGRQRLLDFLRAHSEAALGALLETTTEEQVHQLPQVVGQLQQPVYFFAGAQDMVMEVKYVRHLASFHADFKLGGREIFELPDCGHFAMLEQTDRLSQQILQILDTVARSQTNSVLTE